MSVGSLTRPAIAGITAAGALFTFVGSLLPWARLAAPLIGEITKTGTDGDGIITLLAALAAAIVAAWYMWGPGVGTGRCIALAALGGLVVLVAIVDIADVEGRAADLERDAESLVIISVGEGLYVTLVGGIAIAAGGVLGFLKSRKAELTNWTEDD